MKILVGSKNPVKIEGTKQAFETYYENVDISGISVSSNVPDQPVNEQVYAGAKNRTLNLIKYAKENNIDADFYASIESGIINLYGKWLNINIAVIIDKNGYESIGTSEAFPIPEKYVETIKTESLGAVMDKFSHVDNIAKKTGGVYFLTRKTTRTDLTRNAFIMALTQFVNGDLWKD